MFTLPNFEEEKELWKQGYDLVIGVDEVGRGSFAGPVVAGAVAFPCHAELVSASAEILKLVQDDSIRIDDSKRLKPQEREKAAAWIKKNCLAYGIGEIGVVTINKIGIGKATEQAMRLAVASIMYKVSSIKKKNLHDTKYLLLNTKPFILVDAFYIPYVRGMQKAHQKPIVRGDQKSISIAAASIIAKIFRDSLMHKFGKRYSIYGWDRNKGYGTRHHQEAIKQNGITRLHRKAFVETFLSRLVSRP